MGAIRGREAEFHEAVEIALDYATTLDCPRLHVMAGFAAHGAAAETFAENLAWAAPLAKQAGVALLLEPLNAVDFPGYLVGDVATARAIIAASGADNVFLQYDVYHMQMSQGRLAATFRDHQPLIRHIQIAGVPGRNEPDRDQEINVPMLFALFDQLGYSGWIGCEYRPRAQTTAGLGWAAPWGIHP